MTLRCSGTRKNQTTLAVLTFSPRLFHLVHEVQPNGVSFVCSGDGAKCFFVFVFFSSLEAGNGRLNVS